MERWERSVNDDEEELDIAKQAEQKQMSEIDKDMRKLEAFKTEKMSKKNDLDNMDEEIAKVRALSISFSHLALSLECFQLLRCYLQARRDVGNVAKELQSVQKIINGLETKIDQKKSERHSILKQSKVN